MTDTSPSAAAESSLDRYLESQAGLQLSQASVRRGTFIMRLVGGIMMLIAAGVIVGSLLAGDPQILPAAAGPGMAGLVNFIVGETIRRRAKPAFQVNTSLTPEARTFLANLMKDVYGWPRAWGAAEPGMIWAGRGQYMSKFERRRERSAWVSMYAKGSWGKRQRASKDCLTPQAFDVLDRAAYQYNRVAAGLASGHADITRFSASIKGAADQAMADVFHIGHMIDNFPESPAAAKVKAEQEISALKELADRLEAIQQQPESSTQSASASAINTVLEELRLDQLARSELRPEEKSETHLKAQG